METLFFFFLVNVYNDMLAVCLRLGFFFFMTEQIVCNLSLQFTKKHCFSSGQTILERCTIWTQT